MSQFVKSFIITCVVIVLGLGAIYYKNSAIEKDVSAELDKMSDEDFFTYDNVECQGVIETDCRVLAPKFVFKTKEGQDDILIDFIKIYNMENYFDLDKNIENKDIKIKVDFVGFNLKKSDFLAGVKDKFLVDLLNRVYDSANKFSINSEFVVNFKSKEKGILNKFNLQKLEIKSKHLSLDGNLVIKNLSFENIKDSIVQNISSTITNENMEELFIKWLNNMQKNYPNNYKEACEIVDLDPKTAKPLRVFGKLRKAFANEITADGINNSQLTIQKDYFLALKALIEGKSKVIKISLNNKTSISIADFISGMMMAMMAKQDTDKYILNNFELNIESK